MPLRRVAVTLAASVIASASFALHSSAAADVIEECSAAFDPADAIPACTEIVASSWATEKQVAYAFNNRANAHDYFGRSRAAIEDYSRALALDPHFVNARYNRGTTYLALEDFPDAIADFNAVLKLEPGRADAFNNRGLALLARGDLADAIDDFTSAVRLDAGYAYAFNNRGVAWRRMGDISLAIEDFCRAIDQKPDYVGALNSRGELHLATGDRGAALSDFRRALKVDPEHAVARRNLEAMTKSEVRSWQP